MIRAFIDSSVLFAAAYSSTGNAHDLVQLGIENKITLVLSDDVIVEVRRNFEKKYPDRLAVVDFFFDKAAFDEAVSPTPEEVMQAASYTELKDAPIVAAAIKAACTHLITYDRKHLLEPPQVSEKLGLIVTTPDVVVSEITGSDSDKL
jgi:predicted nucleic acid-binding protein